jgi:hypothetical protein
MPEIRHHSPAGPRGAKPNGTTGLTRGSAGFLGGPGHSPLPAMASRMEGFLGGCLEDGVSRV